MLGNVKGDKNIEKNMIGVINKQKTKYASKEKEKRNKTRESI